MMIAALAVALSPLAAGCNDAAAPTGIRVELDLATFTDAVTTLKLTISADPGGFQPIAAAAAPAAGVQMETQPNSADPSALDLLMTFSKDAGYTFQQQIQFRITTGNRADLHIGAELIAFDATHKIASAKSAAPVLLPRADTATLSLQLQKDESNVTPQTTTLDLAMAAANLTIKGAQMNGHLTAAAVCDADHDGKNDIVIGVPQAVSDTLTVTGAVYVVFGGGTASVVDLGSAPPSQAFHFYGQNGGDQLGASIACADVTSDGIPDLIVGAPGAFNAGGDDSAGRVYVVAGRANLANTTIKIGQGSAGTGTGPDVEWAGPGARANLGQTLIARDLDGDGVAEILVAAPGDGGGMVHLLARGAGWPAGAQVLNAATSRVSFAGAKVAAIAAGDLDGDGTGAAAFEIILGEPSYRMPGGEVRGAVHVFQNVAPATARAFDAGATGPLGPQLQLIGGTLNAGFGAAVASLNLAGDGDDLVVGAPGGNVGAGAVLHYVHDSGFFAGAPAAAPVSDRTLAGAADGDRFGSALAGAISGSSASPSDVQLLVGAPATAHGSLTQAGAVYVYRNFRQAMPELVVQIFGGEMGAHLGAAVAGGQVDANQIADAIAIAPDATGAATGAGAAFVRFGQ